MTLAMWIFGLLTVLSGLGVVLCRKALNSALCLVATLFLVAVHFAMMEAHFLAALQIVVYAGAIMVLVIFVIMLLGSASELEEKSSLFVRGFLVLLSAGMFVLLYKAISQLGLLGRKATDVVGSTEAVGELLFTKYLVPFELASILLLAAVIGAVFLAQDKKRPLPPGRGLRAKRGEA